MDHGNDVVILASLVYVADYDRLAYEAVAAEQVLELLGEYVIARGGNDDVLLFARDIEKSVAVEPAEIARIEPTVADA